MLFLYTSKRRHVEPLLNCSANRWRFSRCLYEIKWNIPIKKRHFPRLFTLHCLTFSLSYPSLSFFFSFFLSVFVSVFSTFTSFFFWLASGLGKGTLLKVKWKVDRFVLPITTSPGKQESTKHLSEFRANQQTGILSPTLQGVSEWVREWVLVFPLQCEPV